MTFFQFAAPQPGQKYDYPTLGFFAADGAILDGTASNPQITATPDAHWTVVASGPESGITRYRQPQTPPDDQSSWDGSLLVYDATVRAFVRKLPSQALAPGSPLDAAVAPLVPSSSGSATAAALSAAYASVKTFGPLRAVALGDSTVAGELSDAWGNTVQVGQTWTRATVIGQQQAGRRSWFTQACLQSGGRLLLLNNAGVASDNSDGCISRFQTDVAAWSPNIALLQMGVTNDVQQSLTLAHSQANVKQAVALCRQAGIQPVLVTIYPNNQSQFAQPTRTYNAWLRQYASRNSLPLVDPYSAVVDPTSTTGAWLAASTLDGVHSSVSGAKDAGARVLADLADQGIIGATPSVGRSPFLPVSRVGGPTYPENMLLNPLMQDDTNPADGRADSWAGSGATFTLVTDPAVVGKAQQMDVAAGQQLNYYQQITVDGTNLRVGDKLAWAGMAKVTAAAGAMYWQLGVYPVIAGATANPTVQPMKIAQSLDMGWFSFYCETIVPSGATYMRVGPSTTGGTGTVWLAQQRLSNLTELGL